MYLFIYFLSLQTISAHRHQIVPDESSGHLKFYSIIDQQMATFVFFFVFFFFVGIFVMQDIFANIINNTNNTHKISVTDRCNWMLWLGMNYHKSLPSTTSFLFD